MQFQDTPDAGHAEGLRLIVRSEFRPATLRLLEADRAGYAEMVAAMPEDHERSIDDRITSETLTSIEAMIAAVRADKPIDLARRLYESGEPGDYHESTAEFLMGGIENAFVPTFEPADRGPWSYLAGVAALGAEVEAATETRAAWAP